MIRNAMLYNKLSDNKVQCQLCAHTCRILPDKFGICGVRQNVDGNLKTHVYGNPVAQNIDPIEKKPLYHFYPGTQAYSIATVGCNFKCGFCQNWQISQKNKVNMLFTNKNNISPADIVKAAKNNNCKTIAYTYTEPTIFFEYAYDTAKLAALEDISNIFVTNGYMTQKAIDMINPFLDAANIDLKSFSDSFYQHYCNARLDPVLNTINYMHKLGIWIEITTLIIPDKNDSENELAEIAGFIADIDTNIPWHISAFHPSYLMNNINSTSYEKLETAKNIGLEKGLKYIYMGNVPADNNTRCHNCGNLLISRSYMSTLQININNNQCPVCNTVIRGIW